jgi:hypothetical protein
MSKLIIMAALSACIMNASAALVAGDITVIGYRSDGPDGLSFVSWKDIAAGTSLYFTDHGFFDDGTLRSSENVMSWTAPVGGLSAGSVVVISCPDGSSTASAGSTAGQLDGLSNSGDQIFVGTAAFPTGRDTTKPGESYSGTLLYGLNFTGSSWAADATSSNTSALPDALNGSYLNQSFAHVDNGQYTGSRSGLSIEQFKAAIHNSENWTFDDGGNSFGTLDGTPFSMVIPEPATMGLVALFGGALLLARRLFPHV